MTRCKNCGGMMFNPRLHKCIKRNKPSTMNITNSRSAFDSDDDDYSYGSDSYSSSDDFGSGGFDSDDD